MEPPSQPSKSRLEEKIENLINLAIPEKIKALKVSGCCKHQNNCFHHLLVITLKGFTLGYTTKTILNLISLLTRPKMIL